MLCYAIWEAVLCAGKLSDVLYVPPWRIATGGVREISRWIVLPYE